MTQLRSARLVCIALGEHTPIPPGSFERARDLDCSARTLDAFLAEVDADAVLAFDGARVAASLRRHERCALLPILVFGPPDAALPPGCDAIASAWSDDLAARVLARARRSVPGAEPARDSERRARRFARWLTLRVRGDAADAAAFGVEAPHTLLAAWHAAGRVAPVADGGWRARPALAAWLQGTPAPSRPCPDVSTAAAAPALAPATTAARTPGRFGWPALLLALFALLTMQGGGWLGGGVRDRSATPARDRLVIGTMPPRAEAAPRPRLATSPSLPPTDPALAAQAAAAPASSVAYVIALAQVLRAEASGADVWLEVELEPGVWHATAADAVEARFGGMDAPWQPLRTLTAEPRPEGGVHLRVLAPGAWTDAPLLTQAELRWPARVDRSEAANDAPATPPATPLR
jgi:hypothetical protein